MVICHFALEPIAAPLTDAHNVQTQHHVGRFEPLIGCGEVTTAVSSEREEEANGSLRLDTEGTIECDLDWK